MQDELKIVPVRPLPLYQQVANQLEKTIRTQMQVGDRLPAEHQLAERFEVSIVTMREAMMSLVRGGLITRRRGSGSFVAETQPPQHVAVLMPRILEYSRRTPNFLISYDILCRELDVRSIANQLYVGRMAKADSPELPAYPELEAAIADGKVAAVCVFFRAIPEALRQRLRERQIPLIGWPADADVQVRHQTVAAVEEAMAWLFQQGRRKVAYIDFLPQHHETAPGAKRAYAAFCSAHEQAGVQVESRWVKRDLAGSLRGAGWNAFMEIWQAKAEKPDAILIADEAFFSDVATAIIDCGIEVPQQLQVVTQATADSGVFYPFPTALLEVDPQALALAVCAALETMLAGEAIQTQEIALPVRFVQPLQVKAFARK